MDRCDSFAVGLLSTAQTPSPDRNCTRKGPGFTGLFFSVGPDVIAMGGYLVDNY